MREALPELAVHVLEAAPHVPAALAVRDCGEHRAVEAEHRIRFTCIAVEDHGSVTIRAVVDRDAAVALPSNAGGLGDAAVLASRPREDCERDQAQPGSDRCAHTATTRGSVCAV